MPRKKTQALLNNQSNNTAAAGTGLPPKGAKLRRPAKASKPPKTKAPKPVHPKAKITFRHNFLPPIVGILMMLGVLGLLNGQWLVAQYQYRFAKPVNVNNFPTQAAAADPNAPAHLYIPTINVSAPIVTDTKTYNQPQVQLALRRGVVQYGYSADPGQKGNIVIVGHSSGLLWAPGNYKFVFTLLNKVAKNDRIFIDFKGQRYIYRVDSTEVIAPTNISVLQPTDQPRLTLITCTPVGTSKNRLVVFARQVSPNPATATPVGAIRPVTASAIPN